MPHFPNIFLIQCIYSIVNTLYQENGAQFIKVFISQRSMSNGFIYVVDAHFVDKIEKKKKILDPSACDIVLPRFQFRSNHAAPCATLHYFSRKCMQFSVGFLGRITVRGVSTALLQLLPFERCVRTNAQNMQFLFKGLG